MSLLTSLLQLKSVNDHRGHMVQSYSQQPCTMSQAVTNHKSHSISQWLQECSQRKRNDCFYSLYGGKSNQCKK
ncbi:unnamed protein product, partial [Staurois parvus]